MDGNLRAPTYTDLVTDLGTLRANGFAELRRLRLPALEQAARIYAVAPLDEVTPSAMEALVRDAVEQFGVGDFGEAARYTFGLVPGSRHWPAQDRRKAAAAAYRVSRERFRKAQERTIIEQTAETILGLCHHAWLQATPRPPLADLSTEESSDQAGDESWHFTSFTALLRLDSAPPEAWESRSIVATTDGVSNLEHSISIPRHPTDHRHQRGLDVDLVHGGRLAVQEHPYDSYFRHVIELATPLRNGERHWYLLHVRIPPNQRMVPHYVYVPLRRCDAFTLHLTFDPGHVPVRVWRLDGAPPRSIDDHPSPWDVLAPDRFGEITVRFKDLRPGWGYGVKWQGADEDPD